jgi:RNA polymerase sigma-70 factor (ECF subfamily)
VGMKVTSQNVPGKSDAAAFEQLAVPMLRRLYNLARWLTRDDGEAEDLVQETYARALKGFGSFQAGTNFSAWMFRILRNTFVTLRSGSKMALHLSVDEHGEEELLPPASGTPETALLSASTRQQIQAALERLPVEYREVVLLCDVEEMRYRDIAELLNVPIGTVMSRLSRARKILRGMLAEERLKV